MNRLPFDAETIRALAAILTETGLSEIELAEGERRIRVVRTPPPGPALTGSGPVVSVPPPPTPAPVTEALADHPGAVKSPMVGIAYLSSEPGAPPFVALGQSVTAGQTLLVIEAMKTFNQIKAPVSGTVSRIFVSPGSPVEYGEVLMIVE